VLATLVTVAGTARLGVWQLDRAAQKVALQEARVARPTARRCRPASWRREARRRTAQWHRKAVVDGVWLADHTVYLDNRPMSGRTGFFVVTPLLLD
jgi:surfeit locus 1 family protein